MAYDDGSELIEAVADEETAARLEGRRLPALRLPSTGGEVALTEAASGILVVYVYPRTGVPGQPLPEDWDRILGARGCTVESCAFRDLERELRQEGATVMGLSAQPLDEQREFAGREQVPYPLLNDSKLELATTLGLPTFDVAGTTLYRRLTLIVIDGRIAKVLHRELAPELHPVGVLDWLLQRKAR
jgi:peroxiredoxin